MVSHFSRSISLSVYVLEMLAHTEKVEEDYKNFDPRRYWAIINNEAPISPPGIKEREKLEELIDCCKQFRSQDEMLDELHIPLGKLIRLLEVARHTRGILVERRSLDGEFIFRLRDQRTQR